MASKHQQQYICFALFITSIFSFQATSRTIRESSIADHHEQWMAHYRIKYKNNTEKERRFKIFKANVEYIEKFNKGGEERLYKLGINQFADWENEEFMAAYDNKNGKLMKKKSSADAAVFMLGNSGTIPPSMDWRKKGAVTPIRDEPCGEWAFPAVDAVEGITKIKTGKLYTLSVQEIVDCAHGGNQCSGGFIYEAFEFIKEHGLTTKTNYPYKGDNSTCNTNKEKQPIAKIKGYKNVLANSEAALLNAVAEQPVATIIDASGLDFQFYSSGVFSGKCGTALNHGVTMVGYGTDNHKVKYWLIKNSWGTNWGEDGYMRMQRDINTTGGLCGIAMEASYPIA